MSKTVIDGKLNPELGLNVGGSLYLRGTNIKILPDNLNVGGSLYLGETNIKILPDNLNVGGSLYLRDTNITNYPVIYNCGDENRAIYLDLKDKNIIHIGCFEGTREGAIRAIKNKYYLLEDRQDYIAKVEKCFELEKKLHKKTRGEKNYE